MKAAEVFEVVDELEGFVSSSQRGPCEFEIVGES